MITGILEHPAGFGTGWLVQLGCDSSTSRTCLSMKASLFYYDLNEGLGCTLMCSIIHCIAQTSHFVSHCVISLVECSVS
jgi:hypothetical protein